MSKNIGDYAGLPLCLKYVVFLINILNKLYGLIIESTKIYAQFNSISRTGDQEDGEGLQRG